MLTSRQLKKVNGPYKAAIDIFAPKLSDSEKKILLAEMKEKTEIRSAMNEYLHYNVFEEIEDIPWIFTWGTMAISLVSRQDFEMVMPYTAVMILANKLREFFTEAFDDTEGATYVESNIMVMKPEFTKETAFHEAVHFLEGKKIINDSEEAIPVAATSLFMNEDLNDIIEECRKKSFIREFFSDHTYDEGNNLAKTTLEIRNKEGKKAAWDFLYQQSQIFKPSPFPYWCKALHLEEEYAIIYVAMSRLSSLCSGCF